MCRSPKNTFLVGDAGVAGFAGVAIVEDSSYSGYKLGSSTGLHALKSNKLNSAHTGLDKEKLLYRGVSMMLPLFN